ncbi:MAG TPA: type II/IV secretion system ATPase subunit [Dehalococcoidia bacterium]|nr:type II/IV secretion system ATPase subunit [Dehalococcoidia bacterium]
MTTTALPQNEVAAPEQQEAAVPRIDVTKLSQSMMEITEQYPHVMDYLKTLPVTEAGLPRYTAEPSRKLSDNKKPNYIYPTTREGVFIHIRYNPDDTRNDYIAIEPDFGADLTDLMARVDEKLLELRDRIPRVDLDLDTEEQIHGYLDLVTTLGDDLGFGFIEKQLGFLRKSGARVSRIKITEREREGLKYMFTRDRVGLGALDPLTSDPYIEDISCSGKGQVFIEHKIFKALKSSVDFQTHKDLDEFVLWLSERIKKPVTFRNPIVDATLPDGSRINIVFGREVSRRGSNFSIRKFAGTPISIFELIDFGSLSYQMLAYLSLVIGNEMNVFVSGETASGKTTLLNAVTTFIHPMAKVVSIEDTPELQVPHKNWIREVVQTSKIGEGSGVDMFDLLKAALRQRPNEIIIGEIRGAEGNIAFQAMQTGHAVMATFHAASVEKLIQRMTGSPISVPKSYVDNLNVVILTSAVQLPNGKTGRRVTGINEIVAFDPVFDAFTFVEIFHWNEELDIHEFTGYMTSIVLENMVAPRMGIMATKKQRIYIELERRAKILEKLHKEQNITGFYEILNVLGRAQRQGLF